MKISLRGGGGELTISGMMGDIQQEEIENTSALPEDSLDTDEL